MRMTVQNPVGMSKVCTASCWKPIQSCVHAEISLMCILPAKLHLLFLMATLHNMEIKHCKYCPCKNNYF